MNAGLSLHHSSFFSEFCVGFDHGGLDRRLAVDGPEAQGDIIGLARAKIQPAFRQEEIMLRSGLPITAKRVAVEIEETIAGCFQMQMPRHPDRRRW